VRQFDARHCPVARREEEDERKRNDPEQPGVTPDVAAMKENILS